VLFILALSLSKMALSTSEYNFFQYVDNIAVFIQLLASYLWAGTRRHASHNHPKSRHGESLQVGPVPRVAPVTRTFGQRARTGLKSSVSDFRVRLSWEWGVESGGAWDRKSGLSDKKNEGKGQSHYADRRSVSSTVCLVV